MPTERAGDVAVVEHGREMALNRLVFGALIAVYFVLTSRPPVLLVAVGCYLAFACVLAAWLRWRPGRGEQMIRAAALVADLGVLSLCMHLDGGGAAALFPLYLWVIQGNGFRFGIPTLFASTAVAFVGFAAVVVSTPYWWHQQALSLGLLAAIVVLPAYSSTLIRKLSRARQQAEEASRAKSMFLAAISHELRTPLNAILGSVSLIEGSPLDDEQRSLFQAMRTGTQALLSLIENILDFSRAEAGLMPVAFEPLDLAALLVEIRDLVATQARLKSLQLSVHASADVPMRIVGDRKHLQEVLLNLVANAIKFTESGGICLSVELEAGSAANGRPRLRFEISDTGIGIAPEAQARIFDVFAQADPSILDRFGGTGLGLAVSRQLVTLMGGEISVDSRVGQGSTFWFTLDLIEAEADATPVVATAMLLCDDAAMADTLDGALQAQGLLVRRIAGLQNLAASSARSGGEILFLYRRDPDGDLPGDCALLGRLDPRAALPRILLCHPQAPVLPAAMLKRHFITSLALPVNEPALTRACRLAAAAAAIASPLPATLAAAPGEAQPTPGAKPDGSIGQPLHVLVADDNDINRRVIGKILERSGHLVTVVEDGLQAMDAMEDQSFDVVLMDINMPGMNGLEATRLFRISMPPTQRLPIIALTADATEETQRNCLKAGMDGCITKPIAPARLIATIETLVRDHAAQSASSQRVGVPGASPPATRPSRRGQAETATLPPPGIARLADHPRFLNKVPALDQAVLAELRLLGGDGFIADLLEDFIADAHGLVDRIESAVDALDMTSFRFELHALCSGAANVGAASLREAASAREISQANLASAGRIITNQLRHEVASVEREWRQPGARPEKTLGSESRG